MFWVCVKKKMLVESCVECLRRVGDLKDLRSCDDVVEKKWLSGRKEGIYRRRGERRESRSTSHVVR
jgi:hypothetical protein